jgi:hypothetical protein
VRDGPFTRDGSFTRAEPLRASTSRAPGIVRAGSLGVPTIVMPVADGIT